MTRGQAFRYGVWAATRTAAFALAAVAVGAAPAAFVAGFTTCEIAYWLVKASEEHWREVAARMAATNRELLEEERARVAQTVKEQTRVAGTQAG